MLFRSFAEGPAPARNGDFSGIAQVRGVDPADPAQPARRYVRGGRFDDLDDGRVILGVGLARALRVRVGDRVELWSPAMAERAEQGKAPLPAEFEVCAVVMTGFTEVDNAAALVPLRRFRELWNLGPRAHGLTRSDLEREGTVYQLGLPPNRIDVITAIDGVTFDQAWSGRVLVAVDGLPTPFIGLDELLANERAAARAKDIADVAALVEVRQHRRPA